MQTHHARVITTNAPLEYEPLSSEEVELVVLNYDQIGIDEMRALVSEAHRRPQEGFRAKEIYIKALKITREAEQASLKILEEPPKEVSIILVLPIGVQLLPTILSRVQLETIKESSVEDVLKPWLTQSVAERIKTVEEKIKAKDTLWLQAFKADLQQYVQTGAVSESALKDVQLVLENLLSRGASNKMLLEHLALSIPLTR